MTESDGLKNTVSKDSGKSEKIINFEKWLDSYLNFEKTPKKNIFWLETMKFFCGKLKNPERAEPCFHVAGSKGKGSVSMFIASILKAAGFKAGLYTSPHILDFLERVSLSGGKFDRGIYEKAADELMEAVKNVKDTELPGGRGITWFELVTIFAFLSFRLAKTNFAVYEVGLGGRLDSTNVVDPLCACIGPIELEHTEFLGDTVEKIAAEKGGIIKPNSKVIIAKQVPSVRKVFEKIAMEKNAELLFVDDEIRNLEFEIEKITQGKLADNANALGIGAAPQAFRSENGGMEREGEEQRIARREAERAREEERNAREKNHPVMNVRFESKLFSRPINARLKMLGKFQAQNAALAAMAVKSAIPEISEETIEKGLSSAVLPARFEVVPSPENYENIPYLVLDGAHTVNSVTFTMETMEETGLLCLAKNDSQESSECGKNIENAGAGVGAETWKKPVLLFACAADKDVKDIAPLFREKFQKIFLTKPGNVKISDIKKMEQAFCENGIEYDFDADFSSQIKKALNFAGKTKSVLLVTGSFYLVAEAKRILSGS